MSAIKLHLEQAEYEVVARYAEAMGVSTEDVAYAAINRLMLLSDNHHVSEEIVETRDWRRHNLPLWADSACSVHAYEGKGDGEPERSRFY